MGAGNSSNMKKEDLTPSAPQGPPPMYTSQGGLPPVPGSTSDLPPPYSAAPNNTILGGAPGNMHQMAYQQQYYTQQPQNYTAPGPTVQGPVHGQFDAGARFNVQNPPSIPPPPPGVAPNQAQMAAMQGRQVMMSQEKGGFLKGSGSGGYTFW